MNMVFFLRGRLGLGLILVGHSLGLHMVLDGWQLLRRGFLVLFKVCYLLDIFGDV
jgi:hypothetical protein